MGETWGTGAAPAGCRCAMRAPARGVAGDRCPFCGKRAGSICLFAVWFPHSIPAARAWHAVYMAELARAKAERDE